MDPSLFKLIQAARDDRPTPGKDTPLFCTPVTDKSTFKLEPPLPGYPLYVRPVPSSSPSLPEHKFPMGSRTLPTASQAWPNVPVRKLQPQTIQHQQLLTRIRQEGQTRLGRFQRQSLNHPGFHHERRYLEKHQWFFRRQRANPRKHRKRKRLSPTTDTGTAPDDVCATFWNGGTARFPPRHWKTVITNRARDIQVQCPIYTNTFAHPAKTGVCFFVDLDFTCTNQIYPARDDIFRCAFAVQDVVKEYYLDRGDFRMWVLLSHPKAKPHKDWEQPLVKVGAHIVFPHVVLNSIPRLKQMTHSVQNRLRLKTGFANAVDDCFKTQCVSLRPVYSLKIVPCPECQNDEEVRFNCGPCQRRGRMECGSYYEPSALFDSHGQSLDVERKRLLREDLVRLLCETSILPFRFSRADWPFADVTPHWACPPHVELYVPDHQRSRHPDDANRWFVFRGDRQYMRPTKNGKDVSHDRVVTTLQKLVRSFHTRYKNVEVYKVEYDTKFKSYRVEVCGPGSRFCRLAKPQGHQHSGNHIRFFVQKRRGRGKKSHPAVSQRCFNADCRKKRDTFIGRNLTPSEVAVLYPELGDNYTFRNGKFRSPPTLSRAEQFSIMRQQLHQH